jgi:phage terminase small subunit
MLMSKAKKSAPKRNGPATVEMRKKRVPQLAEDEQTFVNEIIAGKKPGAAASKAGHPPSKADALLKRPKVQAYLEQYNEHFVKAMAEQEAKVVITKCPTRAEVVNRLWEIAGKGPLGIAESMAAQVAACKEISEVMGYKQKAEGDDLTNYTEEELNLIAEFGLDAEGKPNRGPASIN